MTEATNYRGSRHSPFVLSQKICVKRFHYLRMPLLCVSRLNSADDLISLDMDPFFAYLQKESSMTEMLSKGTTKRAKQDGESE